MKRFTFSIAAFLGSFLLFQQELIAAKMLLPYFGGGSHVWLTSMVYFLGVLFFAYLYTDLISRKLSLGYYRYAHLGFLVLSVVSLPFAFSEMIVTSNPIWDIIKGLTLTITPTFFLLATSTTMLQVWYARTKYEDHSTPYFLYSSSNWGSLIGLFSYPFIMEYFLDLNQQVLVWCILFGVYILLVGACALQLYPRKFPISKGPASLRDYTNWIVMSAAGCSLMLTVTDIVATDIGNIPLIWIFPLIIYLLTIILNFKKKAWYPKHLNTAVLIAILLVFSYLRILPPDTVSILEVLFHYLVLFVICMICHRDLYDKRPAEVNQMTLYYSSIAFGGWLGSLFTAIIAPVIGRSITNLIWEYAFLIIIVLSAKVLFNSDMSSVKKRMNLTVVCLTGILLIAVGRFSEKDAEFGLRNFYGRYLITKTKDSRILNHGTTAHGEQFLDPKLKSIPLSYYHPKSPIGDIFRTYTKTSNVGVVGLGIGSLLTYAKEGESWDIYEIDPDVVEMAKTFFDYLPKAIVVPKLYIGDGRLNLDKQPDDKYDLLILDAFSSDSVPTHLITQEALTIYLKKIKEGGVIVFQISNRFIELQYPLQNLADNLALTSAHKLARIPIEKNKVSASHWFVMSKDSAYIDSLINQNGWTVPVARPNMKSWTDSYSNIISFLKF